MRHAKTKKVSGILAGLGALVLWFARGTIETWFFDNILSMIEPLPSWSMAIEYGPPAIFALVATWLLWSASRDQNLLRAEHGELPEPQDLPTLPDGMVPLPDAARVLYEVARSKGTLIATAAERLSGNKDGKIDAGTPEDILDFMATYIGGKALLYGSRPPSERRELISRKESQRGKFESGALVLKGFNVYTDLVVSRDDLYRIISALDSHEI